MTPERIGPRQTIAVSSSGVSRLELTTSIAERVNAGTKSGRGWALLSCGSRSMPSGSRRPKRRGIDGPVMSASRMPTRRFARRRPTASIPVVSDLPTPPLPDMTATTCLNGARRANAPGARFSGRRSSFMIVGTRPESRAWVSAARMGSTRNPCAEAPCSRVSLALTAHPVQPKPKADSTSWAIGRAATSSRRLVCGEISTYGMTRRLQHSGPRPGYNRCVSRGETAGPTVDTLKKEGTPWQPSDR